MTSRRVLRAMGYTLHMSAAKPVVGSIAAEHDPLIATLDNAPALEDSVSEDEETLVAQSKAQVASGAPVIAHDEAMRRLRSRLGE